MTDENPQISFDATAEELDLIAAIIERGEKLGFIAPRMTTIMDLVACNANGCPMDFKAMLEADDFNLMHDLAGINGHMDRNTGKLTRCFLPRFAKKDIAA